MNVSNRMRLQKVIRFGIPEIDSIFGNKLSIGTLVLIEYSGSPRLPNIFVRCFLAEGVLSGHGLFYGNCDSFEDIRQNLPDAAAPKDTSATESSSSSSQNEEMKIAWRYNQLPTVDESVSRELHARVFDLSKKLSADVVSRCQFSVFDKTCWKIGNNYEQLLNKLFSFVPPSEDLTTADPKPKSTDIYRIAVENLGSDVWGEPKHVAPFIIHLKALLSCSFSVAVVTVPSELMNSPEIQSVRDRSHIVLFVKDLVADLNVNPLYSEYHAILKVKKLTSPGHMSCFIPAVFEYGCKVRRTRLKIEPLHIPPEFSQKVEEELFC